MKLYLFTKSWIALCIIIPSFNCLAQGEYNNWYFGDSAGVTFNGGTPVSIANGKLASYEGCSSISDNTGNLLFYSNGINVWNKNHLIMPNGTGLMGHTSSTQSALIVPQPGSTTIYYLFTTDAQEGAGRSGLRYSIIDMTLQGGLGDVTIKNTLLLAPVGEHLTACRNASGCAFWVLSQKGGTNAFYAYLLSSSGVDTIPVISNIGPMPPEDGGSYGSFKFNRQGTKLAKGSGLFDFNNVTGKLSNYVSLAENYSWIVSPGGAYFYSVEFSPNGNLVYGTTWYGAGIHQWNLLAGSGTPADIVASQVYIGGNGNFGPYTGQLQLGPDDKIYVANYDDYSLSVIDKPDNVGVNCNYLTSVVSLSGKSQLGLPNFPVNLPITVVPLSCLNPDFYYYGECWGDTTTFKNTSKETVFQWDFGDITSGINNNISSLRNPKHLFSGAGTYSITLISGTGNTADTVIKSIIIQQSGFLTVSPDISVCKGDTVTLTANGGLPGWNGWYGSGDNNYGAWYGLHYADTLIFTVYPSDYIFLMPVTAYNGYCYETDTVKVTSLTVPDAKVTASQTICSGESTVITASGGGSYLWNTGSSDSILAVSPQSNKEYWVAVSINSCIADTAKTSVTVLSAPTVNLGETITIMYGTGVAITNTVSGTYQWTPATGLNCTDCASPFANPITTTTYYTTVSNANGCEGADSVTIVVYICGDVFIPSAFSPNNDGYNDVLFANINCSQKVDFKIFDRWGNAVFETIDPKQGWDGRYKGKEMNPDVFVYYMNATVFSGEVITRKGNISLLK